MPDVVCCDTARGLRRQLSSLDTSGLDADGSRAVVAESQLFRGAVDAQLVAVAQRINELAVEGLSADAEGVFLAAGRVSAGEARREARRAGVATELSAFGDALRSGAIGGEHVDVMAGALRGLDADEREHLVGRQAGLVEAGGRLDPDGFRRHVRRVVDRVRADHGLKRAEAHGDVRVFGRGSIVTGWVSSGVHSIRSGSRCWPVP